MIFTFSLEYFFNKNARDLDLVESAFIAGMVKGPNNYNPFTKKNDYEKIKAKKLARMRKDYVIKNMKKLGLITQNEYLEALGREVPFNEGNITYRLNVIMDYIREQLGSKYFSDILHMQGVDNIATSGIQIYTSISEEIQQGALNSIRKQLPILDVQISGYDKGLFQQRYIKNTEIIPEAPRSNLPFFSNISNINRDSKNPYINVVWEGGEGTIDYNGIKILGESWLKWHSGISENFNGIHAVDFLKNFQKLWMHLITEIT